jgi:hypothetical protein
MLFHFISFHFISFHFISCQVSSVQFIFFSSLLLLFISFSSLFLLLISSNVLNVFDIWTNSSVHLAQITLFNDFLFIAAHCKFLFVARRYSSFVLFVHVSSCFDIRPVT